MNKLIKKTLSLIISTAMMLSLIPVINVSAAYTINGKSVDRTSIEYLGNGECWNYANGIYNIIWGKRFDSSFTNDNMLRNLSDSDLEFTKEHAREYISKAELGAVIRISNFDYLHANSEWSGHSFIIVQKDDNGFTTLESISTYPNDGRREKYWTYEGFAESNSSHYGSASWRYKYIKYIKWPGAAAYTPGNTHTHSWSQGYDSSHPHNIYNSCSCGAKQYTGYTKLISSCQQCYPLGNVKLTRSFNKTAKDVTLYRNNVSNANSYTLTLYRNGNAYDTYTMTGESKYISSLPSGVYTAELTAKNTSTNQTKSAKCDSFTIIDTYDVVYDANGGTNAPSSQMKIKDTDLTITSSIPTKTGYVFKGWASNKTATEAQYQPGGNYTKNTKIVLYAVWEPEIYTINFDVNGGKGEVQSTTITYGNTMKMPNSVIREGYYLKGWTATKGATTPDYKLGMDYKLTSNATLYAVWGQSTWSGSIASGFAGGDGTEANPYQISNAAELAYLADIVNNQQSEPDYAYYILTDNINLGYEEWVPIGLYGNENQYFKGSFDGNGYTISDLFISDVNEGYVGLFGYAKDSELKGLTVSGDITGINSENYLKAYIGGIIGLAYNTDIKNCTGVYINISDIVSNSGDSYTSFIGSICGATSGDIITCYVDESYIGVKHGNFRLGGIVGYSNGIIENCKVKSSEELFGTADETGHIYIGGICGEKKDDQDSKVYKCAIEAGFLSNNIKSSGDVVVGGISGTGTVNQCTVNFSNGIEKNIDDKVYNSSLYVKSSGVTMIGGIVGAGSAENCKYNGQSISGESDANLVCVGGIGGCLPRFANKCFVNVDGIIYGSSTGWSTYVGGIVGEVSQTTDSSSERSIANVITIADKIASFSYNYGSKCGDILGESAVDSVATDNMYSYSSMELEAVTNNSNLNGVTSVLGSTRTLAQIKRASFLNQVFGPAYQSLDYLEENPEAVWVIKDGEYPELYFNLLNDITLSEVENGTISVDKTQAVDGEIVTVTATPAKNYLLNKIYVNGNEIVGNTFEVSGDSDVYATFAEKTAEYTISVENTENATATLANLDTVSLLSSAELFTTSLSATDGEEIKVNTNSAEDYTIDAVYVNGEELASDSFIVTDDSKVTLDVASISTDIKATTYDATDVGSYYATLSGSVEGDADSTEKYIRYWSVNNPDVVYTTDIETGNGEYSVTVYNLELGAEYKFQMTETGEVKTFTTAETAPDGGVGDEEDNGDSSVAVTGVSLNKSSTTINVGSAETLIATVKPTNATNKAVTWTSSNTGVATVSSSGVVTAKSAGTTTITVTTSDGSKTAKCTVTVVTPTVSVTGVSLNKSSTTISVGSTETLTATVTPSNSTNKAVTWTSSDTNVTTVSSSGLVTAKAAGTATIIATTADGGKIAICNVTVTLAAHEITNLTASVMNEYVLVNTSVANVPDNAKSYIAAYDASGNLIAVQAITFTDGANQTILPIKDISKIKVLVWEADNITPLTEYKEYVIK